MWLCPLGGWEIFNNKPTSNTTQTTRLISGLPLASIQIGTKFIYNLIDLRNRLWKKNQANQREQFFFLRFFGKQLNRNFQRKTRPEDNPSFIPTGSCCDVLMGSFEQSNISLIIRVWRGGGEGGESAHNSKHPPQPTHDVDKTTHATVCLWTYRCAWKMKNKSSVYTSDPILSLHFHGGFSALFCWYVFGAFLPQPPPAPA